MSSSLRDQLLKAGLVSEKQVKQAERQARKPPQRAKPAPAAAQKQTAAERAAKAARDRELNRRQAAKAEAKARQAQVRQLIEQHRLPSPADGEPFYFQDDRLVRRVYVDGAQREKLIRGELAIARYGTGFALLPPAAAERVRERDPNAIIDLPTNGAESKEDDYYAGFEVPDDLMW